MSALKHMILIEFKKVEYVSRNDNADFYAVSVKETNNVEFWNGKRDHLQCSYIFSMTSGFVGVCLLLCCVENYAIYHSTIQCVIV